MASRHPERIKSLHLAAGPFYSILDTLQHPLLSLLRCPRTAATFEVQYLLALTGGLGAASLRLAYRLGLFRLLLSPAAAHPRQLKESVVRALLYQHNPEGLLLMAANAPGYDPAEQWSKVRCPILATFGARDVLVGERDLRRFMKDQPTAKCTVIQNASHLHHIERPLDVAKALDL
jgi:pimeloyl-ACP methyl ester carboxylesterase